MSLRDEVVELMAFYRAEATGQPYEVVRQLKDKYADQILALISQKLPEHKSSSEGEIGWVLGFNSCRKEVHSILGEK